jgi:hypothetical protein
MLQTGYLRNSGSLLAHSNLIDFNKNINIFWVFLNKCFEANQLPLKFNKTNYIHITTNNNRSFSLKLDFNNNLFTSSTHMKFLG